MQKYWDRLKHKDGDQFYRIWVHTCFFGKTSIKRILSALSEYSQQKELCEEALKRLSERSPTALIFTLNLLLQNEGRPIEGVFRADLKAVRFISRLLRCK